MQRKNTQNGLSDQPSKQDEDPIIKDTITPCGEIKDEQVMEVALTCDQVALISDSKSNEASTLRFFDCRNPKVCLKEIAIPSVLCHPVGFGITGLSGSRFVLSLRKPGHYKGFPNYVINSQDKDPIQEAKECGIAGLGHPSYNPPQLINTTDEMMYAHQRIDFLSVNDCTLRASFTKQVSGLARHLTGTTYAICNESDGCVGLYQRNDKELKLLAPPINLSEGVASRHFRFRAWGTYMVKDAGVGSKDTTIYRLEGHALVKTCTLPYWEFVGGMHLDTEFPRLIAHDNPNLATWDPASKDLKMMLVDPTNGNVTATFVCGKTISRIKNANDQLVLFSHHQGVRLLKVESGVKEVIKTLIESGLGMFGIPKGVSEICAEYIGIDVIPRRQQP